MANKLLVLTFQHKGSVTVEAQPELVDAVLVVTMKCAACLLRIRWFTAPPGSPVLINCIDDSSRSCYAATLLAYCNRGAHLEYPVGDLLSCIPVNLCLASAQWPAMDTCNQGFEKSDCWIAFACGKWNAP